MPPRQLVGNAMPTPAVARRSCDVLSLELHQYHNGSLVIAIWVQIYDLYPIKRL
jgi:hypothetical protein